MKFFRHITSIIVGSSVAHAGEITAPPIELKNDSDDWSFQLAPYGWLSGNKGTSGFPNVADDLEVDDSFSDVLEDLEIGVTIFAEARKGKWRTFIDFQYASSSSEGNIDGFSLDATQIRTQLGVGYEIYQNNSTSVFLNAGAIYSYVDNELVRPSENAEVSETWVDPVIGLSLAHQFSDKWHGEASLAYGGFTIASDEVVQATASIGYQFTPFWTGVAGYRYQSFDYSDDGFLYDLETQGPFFGVSYNF